MSVPCDRADVSTYRIIRMHWNQPRWDAVKMAYQHKYGKKLQARVKGETSGKYENMLVAVCGY